MPSFNLFTSPGSLTVQYVVLQGIGEPTVCLGSTVFFAIKDAVAAARSESGLVGLFSLDSPATPERACLACASPLTQKVKMLKYWVRGQNVLEMFLESALRTS